MSAAKSQENNELDAEAIEAVALPRELDVPGGLLLGFFLNYIWFSLFGSDTPSLSSTSAVHA